MRSRKRSGFIARGVIGGLWLFYEQNDYCDPAPGGFSCAAACDTLTFEMESSP